MCKYLSIPQQGNALNHRAHQHVHLPRRGELANQALGDEHAILVVRVENLIDVMLVELDRTCGAVRAELAELARTASGVRKRVFGVLVVAQVVLHATVVAVEGDGLAD